VTLKDLGEFGFIDRIAARLNTGSGVALGIGDDAAAVIPSSGLQTLVTADMLVEGVHFDLAFTGPRELGSKSLAVNLSDIAAMGGIPRFALLSLAIPPALPLDFLDAFIAGFSARAAQYDVTLIGGDTCSSRSGFVIAVTLLGEQQSDRIVRRSGARPGDHLYVTGTVGDSALGLELLRQGERSGAAITRHLDPLSRNEAGLMLAGKGLATAMIDVSDGLVADLGHILKQSGCGATVFLDRLPLSPEYRQRVGEVADDRFSLALSGGEDYELLFASPASRQEEISDLSTALGLPMSAIGEIRAEPGMAIIASDGTPYTPTFRGFDHFAR
jgi:thiamine-monophosphate kinase